MKTLISLLFLLSYFTYSQDQIKLTNQNKSFDGKVLIIKPATVEFEQASTGFKYEFDKEDIDYIVSENNDTIWFNADDDKSKLEGNDNIILPYKTEELKRLTIFFTYNFSGSHNVKFSGLSGELDVNSAISVGAEFDVIKTSMDKIKLGMGIIYQFPRKQSNVPGKFNFIPIYAFLKLGIINEKGFDGREKLRFYLFPTIGYNLFNGDDDYTGSFEPEGGLYNSIGAGFLVGNKLDIKFIYQLNRGYVSVLNEEAKILYTSFGLHFGYYL